MWIDNEPQVKKQKGERVLSNVFLPSAQYKRNT